MSEIILTNEEIQMIRFRDTNIQKKKAELTRLQFEIKVMSDEYAIYNQDVLKGHGLDPEKKYRIDERGVVAEDVEEATEEVKEKKK